MSNRISDMKFNIEFRPVKADPPSVLRPSVEELAICIAPRHTLINRPAFRRGTGIEAFLGMAKELGIKIKKIDEAAVKAVEEALRTEDSGRVKQVFEAHDLSGTDSYGEVTSITRTDELGPLNQSERIRRQNIADVLGFSSPSKSQIEN